MDVSEIKNRILEISHDEATVDTDLNNKALRWLNSAYHEIMNECMPYLTRFVEKKVVVNVVDGVGSIPTDLFRVVSVEDLNSSYFLTESNNKSKGSFYLSLDQIFIEPGTTTALEITYLPLTTDLEDVSTESDILLPKQFHNALVWGGLVWSAIYERGFSTQADMNLFQNKWFEAKREAKLSLATNPAANLRVMSYEIL